MPICWSHAEYISLVRSRHDGVCFDRIEWPINSYVAQTRSAPGMKSGCSTIHCAACRSARLCASSSRAEANYYLDHGRWATKKSLEMSTTKPYKFVHADFETAKLPSGSVIEFTFFGRVTSDGGANYKGEYNETIMSAKLKLNAAQAKGGKLQPF